MLEQIAEGEGVPATDIRIKRKKMGMGKGKHSGKKSKKMGTGISPDKPKPKAKQRPDNPYAAAGANGKRQLKKTLTQKTTDPDSEGEVMRMQNFLSRESNVSFGQCDSLPLLDPDFPWDSPSPAW